MPQPSIEKDDINNFAGPMFQAYNARNWNEVLRLVDQEGADPNFSFWKMGETVRTLMQDLARKGDLDKMQDLYDRGASVDPVKPDGYQKNGPIHDAAADGNIESLEWLRTHGADMKKRGTSGKDILHIAIATRNLELFYYALKQARCPVNSPDDDGTTPLMCLMSTDYSDESREMLYALVARGADVDAANDRGMTALIRSFEQSGDLSYSQILLDLGAKENNPRARKTMEQALDDAAHRGSQPRMKSESYEKFYNEHCNFPYVEPGPDCTKVALFKMNSHRKAPLDNPKTWHNFEAILESLAEKGEVMTREDFLGENRVGKQWIERGVECGALRTIADHLWEQGDPLLGKDFAHDKQTAEGEEPKLSRLGDKVRECQAIPKLFMIDRWKGRNGGSQMMQRFYRDLPPQLQEQFTGVRALAAKLSRVPAQDNEKGIAL